MQENFACKIFFTFQKKDLHVKGVAFLFIVSQYAYDNLLSSVL